MDVYLYGNLKKKYGKHFDLNVQTPAEAIRALQANFGDFYAHIRHGKFKVIRGEKKTGEALCFEQLSMHFRSPVHIVPVPRGSKNNKGIATVLIGVALIAASAVTMGAATPGAGGLLAAEAVSLGSLGSITAGQFLMLGASLALGGVMQMLTPTPKINDYTSREDKKVSFLFNGAINRQEQGGAVPIIYGGPIQVGSILVSGGVRINEARSGVPVDQLATITVQDTAGALIYKDGVEAPLSCTLTPDSVDVRKGTSIKFRIQAQWPYILSDLLVDDVSVGALEEYTFVNVQTNHTIKAVAAIDEEYYVPEDGGGGSA